MGFRMAIQQKNSASLGNCNICSNKSLLTKSEVDVREIFKKEFELIS